MHALETISDLDTGFKATAANLLSVPVYAWACLITLFIGILGDRIGHRGYINLSVQYYPYKALMAHVLYPLQSVVWHRCAALLLIRACN